MSRLRAAVPGRSGAWGHASTLRTVHGSQKNVEKSRKMAGGNDICVFLLCTAFGTGYKRGVRTPQKHRSRDVWQRHILSQMRRCFLEKRRNFLHWHGSSGFARRNARIPVFPPANRLPTASQGAETGVRAFCPRHQPRGLCVREVIAS